MKIILLISNNKEVTDNISEYRSDYLDIIIAKAEQYISSYLEEYLPEYVIANIAIKDIDILNKYKNNNKDSIVFINNTNFTQKNKNPQFIYINELKNKNDLKNIVNIISKIEIENKNTFSLSNYKLINQQIISVFSSKGGTGKTNISFNLAYYIKRTFNAKVILIDLNFSEGACDLASYLGSNQIPNLGYYIENQGNNEESLSKSIIIKDDFDIDILLPPLSLAQYNKMNSALLKELFNTIRGCYNFAVIDLPYGYSDLTAETIKLSNSLIFVSIPIYQCAFKLSKLKINTSVKALNKLSILNNPYNFASISKEYFEDISEYPVLLEIPYINPKNMEFICFNNKKTEIIDMGKTIQKLINTFLIT